MVDMKKRIFGFHFKFRFGCTISLVLMEIGASKPGKDNLLDWGMFGVFPSADCKCNPLRFLSRVK